jgi:hypothetical protein
LFCADTTAPKLQTNSNKIRVRVERFSSNCLGSSAMTFHVSGKVLTVLALLTPVTASASTSEIEHRCTVMYPSVMQYFAWKDRVKVETKREAEEELKRLEEELKAQRQEAARPCLAADLPRMEALATKATAAVGSETSLDEAQNALNAITERQGEIVIPKDSIRERVFATAIETKCDSTFHFLINVREGPDKKLRWMRIPGPWMPRPAIRHSFTASSEPSSRRSERMNVEASRQRNGRRTSKPEWPSRSKSVKSSVKNSLVRSKSAT